MKYCLVACLLTLSLLLAACGDKPPTDSQVETTIRQSIAAMVNLSKGKLKVDIKSIEVGDKVRVGDSGTYRVMVTTHLETDLGGTIIPANETKPVLMRNVLGKWIIAE